MNAGPQLMSAIAGSISGSASSGDDRAGAAEELEHLPLGALGRARAGDVAEHALPHLGRDVGDEAVAPGAPG